VRDGAIANQVLAQVDNLKAAEAEIDASMTVAGIGGTTGVQLSLLSALAAQRVHRQRVGSFMLKQGRVFAQRLAMTFSGLFIR
jgi:hypothetical protein